MSTDLHAGKTLTPMGLLGPRTNIDRRGAERVVPMKVLCLGLGRTGTSSLRAALIELGIRDCYHMCSIMKENPKDAELWVEAFDAKFEGKGKPWGREEFDQVLGHCMAVSDWPCANFADELIQAYPDAKVILTVRDSVDQWHKSVTETLWTGAFLLARPANAIQSFIQSVIPKPEGHQIPKLVFQNTTLNNHPEEGRDGYLKHNEHIREIAPKGKFLEFNVKQGWGPLCEFLDVEVPDRPFPRVNDGKTWMEDVEVQMLRSATKILGPAALIIGAAGALAVAGWLRGWEF